MWLGSTNVSRAYNTCIHNIHTYVLTSVLIWHLLSEEAWSSVLRDNSLTFTSLLFKLITNFDDHVYCIDLIHTFTRFSFWTVTSCYVRATFTFTKYVPYACTMYVLYCAYTYSFVYTWFVQKTRWARWIFRCARWISFLRRNNDPRVTTLEAF